MNKIILDSHRIKETESTKSVSLSGRSVRFIAFSSCDENRAKVSIIGRSGKRREIWIDANLLEPLAPLN